LIINRKKKGKTFIKGIDRLHKNSNPPETLMPKGCKRIDYELHEKKEPIIKEIDRLHKNSKPPETLP